MAAKSSLLRALKPMEQAGIAIPPLSGLQARPTVLILKICMSTCLVSTTAAPFCSIQLWHNALRLTNKYLGRVPNPDCESTLNPKPQTLSRKTHVLHHSRWSALF